MALLGLGLFAIVAAICVVATCSSPKEEDVMYVEGWGYMKKQPSPQYNLDDYEEAMERLKPWGIAYIM